MNLPRRPQPTTPPRKRDFENPHAASNQTNRWLSLPGILLAGLFLFAHSSSAAVKTWSGAIADTLWSNDGNWSPAGAPGAADTVTFTNVDFVALPLGAGGAINNLVDGNFTNRIASLSFMNTNGFHNASIDTPLVVSDTSTNNVAFLADDGEPSILFVGSGRDDGKDPTMYASITGTSLTVNNTNADITVMQISATTGLHGATLDMTSLNTFNCVVSKILVGHDRGPLVPTRPTGILLLGKTNSITANLISIGDVFQNNNSSHQSIISLGQTNAVNVNQVRVGLHKSFGTLNFNPAFTAPTATFRNTAGTGRATSWEIGDIGGVSASANQGNGTLDLAGGTVDALVDRITVGRGENGNGNGDGTGTLTFGAGAIDANYLEMGIQEFGGGSVGHGTLNVNNDPGIGPATLTVNSNVVLAVQLPGSSDAAGCTAVINIDGGTMNVKGDITNGAGLSTINLTNGGTLDLQPAGDPTPGNVAVDILIISDGVLTNYSTLSVSNINLPAAITIFTVNPGQTIAPVAVGTIGTLEVDGGLTLRGTAAMDIAKVDGVLSADQMSVFGVLDMGGTLAVKFSGNTPLAVGDKFTLFSTLGYANSFDTLNLPPPGSGLAWTNEILIDGSIEVIASGEPTTPPTLAVSNSPASINVSWPAAYTSFKLRAQTNPISMGLSTNWGLVPGVVGNQVDIPVNPANGSVFFQLFQQ